MERAAARLNSQKLGSSSLETRAAFNWDFSNRGQELETTSSPTLSPPFATSVESSWPASHTLALRTGDIPGAQAKAPLRPLTQPGPSKWEPRSWLEGTSPPTKGVFLTTTRSINPLEPVYQLPDGASSIPTGSNGETFSARVTDGLAVDDIAGTHARSLYARAARRTRLEEETVSSEHAKKTAQSAPRASSVNISDIDIGAKKWGFQRQIISNPLNPRYFYDPAAAVLRDAADADHRARVAAAANRKKTPLEKIEEKLYWKSEQLRAVCARRDTEQLDSVGYKELHESLEELGVHLDEKEALAIAHMLDKENRGHVNYRDFSRRLRFPDGFEQAESRFISENLTGATAAGTSLGQGARVLAEQEEKQKGRKSEKGQKEWQLLDTLTGRLKIERMLSDDEKRLLRIRQKIVERLDTKLGVLDKAFLKFDENRDGVMSYDEIKNGLADLGIKLRPHELQTLTTTLDKDSKGYIELNNFKENLQQNTLLLDMASLSVKGAEDLQQLETQLKAEVLKGNLSLYPQRHAGPPIAGDALKPSINLSKAEREEAHIIGQLRNRLSDALTASGEKAFRTSESSKDDVISEGELKLMMETLKVGAVSDEEIQLLMRYVDRGRSGTVHLSQLSKALLPQEAAKGSADQPQARLARILKRVRARDPEVFRLVVDRVKHNRTNDAEKQLQDLEVALEPRAPDVGSSEGTSRSVEGQLGEEVAKEKQADETLDRPPSLQELSRSLRELGVYLPHNRLVALLRKIAPPELDPSYKSLQAIKEVALKSYALPPVTIQASEEASISVQQSKASRSKEPRLSSLPSAFALEHSLAASASGSRVRKMHSAPSYQLRRSGSGKIGLDPDTLADIKAVRALS